MKVKQKGIRAHIPKGFLIVLVALSAILGTGIVIAQTTIDIRIAPSTLNLYDVEDKCVTVHAEILYSEVDVSDLDSLTLAGSGGAVTACDAFSDDRGYLVVKFDRAAVEEIVSVGEEVTLTLTGVKKDETGFTGTDTIRVIDRGK